MYYGIIQGEKYLGVTERFKTDLDCEEYLASIKWEKGYCCHKCGHKNTKFAKIFHALAISVQIQKVLLLEHYFKQKVRKTMKSSESHKLNDSV